MQRKLPNDIRREFKIFFYLGSPLLSLLSVLPLLMNVSVKNTLNSPLLLIIIFPWCLGLLVLPLYCYVVLYNVKRISLNGLMVRIVDFSLVGAIVASILGLEAVLIYLSYTFCNCFNSIFIFSL